MKRKGLLFMSVLMLLGIMAACSRATDGSAVNPNVNSGVVDESYVGNPAPVLEEDYVQSPAEEKIQKDVLNRLKNQEDSNKGPSIHGI